MSGKKTAAKKPSRPKASSAAAKLSKLEGRVKKVEADIKHIFDVFQQSLRIDAEKREGEADEA